MRADVSSSVWFARCDDIASMGPARYLPDAPIRTHQTPLKVFSMKFFSAAFAAATCLVAVSVSAEETPFDRNYGQFVPAMAVEHNGQPTLAALFWAGPADAAPITPAAAAAPSIRFAAGGDATEMTPIAGDSISVVAAAPTTVLMFYPTPAGGFAWWKSSSTAHELLWQE
jgi:hypothetical protein